MNEQISVEFLVKQLQQIPGIKISVDSSSDTGVRAALTFEEWAMQWLNIYKKGIVKDNTFNSTYREPVELHLIPYFGEYSLFAVSASDVQIFFRSLSDVLSMETQKKIRNAIKQIYETAIECGYCQFNPVTRSLRLTSSIKPMEKHTWSLEEYHTAYQFALHHPNGLPIIVLMETAISRSELLGLRWSDHDEKNCVLHINSGLVSQKSTITGKYELVNDGLKNRYRQRNIPLSQLTNGLLSLKPNYVMVREAEQPARKVRTEFIFHSPKGTAYDPDNWYRRVLQRFMKDLHAEHPEVPMLTTHELRHTRATLLKDNGTDIFSIARLLGHCDLNMLAKRYAHDNVEALRKALSL
ncbi:MAG: site-specific integrase [Bacillota bacterium]